MKAANDTVSRRIGRVAHRRAARRRRRRRRRHLVVAALGRPRSTGSPSGYGPAADANAAALTYMLDVETGDPRVRADRRRRPRSRPYRRAVHRGAAADRRGARRRCTRSAISSLDAVIAQRAPRRADLARHRRHDRRHAASPTRGARRSTTLGAAALRRVPPRERRGRGAAWTRRGAACARDTERCRTGSCRSRSPRSCSCCSRRGTSRCARRDRCRVPLHRAVGGRAAPRGRRLCGPCRRVARPGRGARRVGRGEQPGHRTRPHVPTSSATTTGCAARSVSSPRRCASGRTRRRWRATLVAGLGRRLRARRRLADHLRRRPGAGARRAVAARGRADAASQPGSDELLLHGLANRLWHAGTVVGHRLIIARRTTADRIDPVSQIGAAPRVGHRGDR